MSWGGKVKVERARVGGGGGNSSRLPSPEMEGHRYAKVPVHVIHVYLIRGLNQVKRGANL